jgi:hypothetical protein
MTPNPEVPATAQRIRSGASVLTWTVAPSPTISPACGSDSTTASASSLVNGGASASTCTRSGSSTVRPTPLSAHVYHEGTLVATTHVRQSAGHVEHEGRLLVHRDVRHVRLLQVALAS